MLLRLVKSPKTMTAMMHTSVHHLAFYIDDNIHTFLHPNNNTIRMASYSSQHTIAASTLLDPASSKDKITFLLHTT